MDDRVVLLVVLNGGDVVAVPFDNREKADRWEERMPFETVGRPRIVTARSLSIDAAKTPPAKTQRPRCLCDGGAYEVREHPFLTNPECPIHGERPSADRAAVRRLTVTMRRNRVDVGECGDITVPEPEGEKPK